MHSLSTIRTVILQCLDSQQHLQAFRQLHILVNRLRSVFYLTFLSSRHRYAQDISVLSNISHFFTIRTLKTLFQCVWKYRRRILDIYGVQGAWNRKKGKLGQWRKERLRRVRNIPTPWDLNLCKSLLSVWIKCVRNSSESCCLIVENSACPFPMMFLIITGLMPSWKTNFCVVGLAFARVLGTEYLPLTSPSAILHIWHSKQSAGSFSHDRSCIFAYEWLYLSSNNER